MIYFFFSYFLVGLLFAAFLQYVANMALYRKKRVTPLIETGWAGAINWTLLWLIWPIYFLLLILIVKKNLTINGQIEKRKNIKKPQEKDE